MHSWVRYSVSAYLGLLIAGSIAAPGPGDYFVPEPVASMRDRAGEERMYIVPGYREPLVEPDMAAVSAES